MENEMATETKAADEAERGAQRDAAVRESIMDDMLALTIDNGWEPKIGSLVSNFGVIAVIEREWKVGDVFVGYFLREVGTDCRWGATVENLRPVL